MTTPKEQIRTEIGGPGRAEPEEDCGWYLYGIVPEGAEGGRPVAGIDPDHETYTLGYQGLRALVSKVSLREFAPQALRANLEDLPWMTSRVQAHQRVLAGALARGPVVPLKFCTIYRSESGVRAALARHYADFMRALAQLQGKHEWGVKVYCDEARLAGRVEEVSGVVGQLRREMAEKSEGAAYFLRKKLEQAVATETERLSDECAQESHDRLAGHAAQAVLNPLHGPELTGRPDRMILNGAYLVAEERRAALAAEVEGLTREFGRLGFCYDLTGPWPAYNFVAGGLEEGATDARVGG